MAVVFPPCLWLATKLDFSNHSVVLSKPFCANGWDQTWSNPDSSLLIWNFQASGKYKMSKGTLDPNKDSNGSGENIVYPSTRNRRHYDYGGIPQVPNVLNITYPNHLMWGKQDKTIPQITMNRWYKPFPYGGLFYPHCSQFSWFNIFNMYPIDPMSHKHHHQPGTIAKLVGQDFPMGQELVNLRLNSSGLDISGKQPIHGYSWYIKAEVPWRTRLSCTWLPIEKPRWFRIVEFHSTSKRYNKELHTSHL